MSALKPPWRREVLRGKGQGQNRTWEIRPSGIVGGPGETEPMAEMGSHLATERAGLVTLCLRAAAPQIYPAQRATGNPLPKGGCASDLSRPASARAT